jgi:RimJ/RimL family protein N-acetyltransferase
MLTVRDAREKDLGRLLEIINEPSVIEHMPLERPVKMDKVRGWNESFVKFRNPLIFVLELDKVIGVCTLNEAGKITIWVDEEHQGKGYGTHALDWLKDYAKRRGMKRLWLECFRENESALEFYFGSGFQEKAEIASSLILECLL